MLETFLAWPPVMQWALPLLGLVSGVLVVMALRTAVITVREWRRYRDMERSWARRSSTLAFDENVVLHTRSWSDTSPVVTTVASSSQDPRPSIDVAAGEKSPSKN